MWAVNFSTMATGNLNFGLFVLPMSEALGMSRSQFGWALTARRVAASLSSFVVGRLIDRYGPRVFIVIAAALMGACLLLLARAAAWQVVPLWIFAAVFGLGSITFAVMRNPKSRGGAETEATAGESALV